MSGMTGALNDLTNPGANRILYWNNTTGGFDWIAPSNGVGISGTSISVKDFEAVGDDVTDDAPRFSAAFAALIAAGGGRLYVPTGVYRIKSRITVSCNAQQHVSLVGDGRYLSTLDFSDAASLGILFESTSATDNQLPSFEVHGIGLITSRDDAGQALTFDYTNPDNIDATVLVSDVFIGQNVDRAADGGGGGFGYWSMGVRCNNCRAGDIRGLHFYGEIDKASDTTHGIYLEGESTEFVIADCNIFEAVNGIEAVGTCEGIFVDNCVITQVKYGIRHTIASGAEPQLMVNGCHVNASEVCVWTQNSQQSVIANSLFYANAYFASPGPWPEWRGVLLQGSNSKFITINNCTFTKESTRTGDTTSGIDLNVGSFYVVNGCQFFGFSGNELTFGVQVRAGVTDVHVGEDQLFEHVTSPVSNAGTRAIRQSIIQRGFNTTVTSGDTITFPQAFNSQPMVAVTILGASPVAISADTFATTGFKVYFAGGGTQTIAWIAAGD